MELLTLGTPALETLFLFQGMLYRLNMKDFAFSIASYFDLFGLEACSYLKRKWKGSESGGEMWWGS